jgi:hypothetical protein
MFGQVTDSTPRSTRVVTLLCIAGLAVAGVALGYCVHLGAERSDQDQGSAQIKYVTPSEPPSQAGVLSGGTTAEEIPGALITERSKVVLCTIDRISSDSLDVHTADGRKQHFILSPDTHVQSSEGSSLSVVDVGDLVVVRVVKVDDKMIADLIVDGRVSGSIPEN